MKKKKIILYATLFILAFLLLACQAQKNNDNQQTTAELHNESRFYLYTEVTISTYGSLESELYEQIWQTLENIDNTLSVGKENSEVASINQMAGKEAVVVSPQTFAIISKALDFNQQAAVFDITVGPLVSLWGIGSDNPHLPTEAEINQALQLIDSKKVILNQAEKSVYLKDSGMQIDLGGIAKGYAADLVRDILIENGVENALLNFGGNIYALGQKADGSNWRVGITTPDKNRNDYVGVVEISDKSIVTSGVYERYFEKDGKRYHHILDIYSGYPVDNQLVAVSIIADSSTTCDALSTLSFALGLEKGLQFIENKPDVEAVFITKDNGITLSSGLVDNFQLSNPKFHLSSKAITAMPEREGQLESTDSENKLDKAISKAIDLSDAKTFINQDYEEVKTALDAKHRDYKLIEHYRRQASTKVIAVDTAPLVLHKETELSKELTYQLQEQLKIAGYYTDIDGDYGPNTKAAMQSFSKDKLKKETADFNSQILTELEKFNAYRYAAKADNYLVLVNHKYNLKRAYQPTDLSEITVKHSQGAKQLRKKAAQQLEQMFAAAQSDGIDLIVLKAYTSFDQQNNDYQQYLKNKTADDKLKPVELCGQSEYQTGLAVQLAHNSSDNQPEETAIQTPAEAWLLKNAGKYGFIQRYPLGKEKVTGHPADIWHYRYIGDDALASQLNKDRVTLEEYLGQ